MKNLNLSLKTKWFLITHPDEKTEDYREINKYWCKRLLEGEDDDMIADIVRIAKDRSTLLFTGDYWRPEFKKFDYNIMTLGYPKIGDKGRTKVFEHLGIEIRYGKEEWGAEPDKLYFVIKHGKQIEI